MKKIMFAAVLLGVAVGASFAQEIRIQKHIIGSPSGEFVLPTFDVITANGAIDAKQIKGAPFAAEFSSENVQTLADGNRIVRNSTSSVHRDNDGRTRREQTLALGGMLPSNSELNRQIFIYDPMTSSNYSLNQLSRTAFRSKVFGVTIKESEAPSKSDQAAFERSAIKLSPRVEAEMKKRAEEMMKDADNRPRPETRRESLGTRDIEGVAADGERVTTVFPAGFMGNEKPIEIVRETWFSKELGMIVLSQTKNPLTGDQTYKLTRLTRGEQPRSLFEVPSDYKVIDRANMLNHLIGVPPINDQTPPMIQTLPGGNVQFFHLPRSSN